MNKANTKKGFAKNGSMLKTIHMSPDIRKFPKRDANEHRNTNLIVHNHKFHF